MGTRVGTVELRKQAEELARSLQESLLPPGLLQVDGLELAARRGREGKSA